MIDKKEVRALAAQLYTGIIMKDPKMQDKSATNKAINLAYSIIKQTDEHKEPEVKKLTVQDVDEAVSFTLKALKPDYAWYQSKLPLRQSDKTYNADKIERAESYIKLKKAIDKK